MSSGPIATPLGRPVVPDVYAIVVGQPSPITSGGSTSGMPAGQPSSTTSRGTSGTCSSAGSRSRVTTTAVAPESVTTQPASSALKWMFTGTTIAPSRPHACVATKNSAEFGTRIADPVAPPDARARGARGRGPCAASLELGVGVRLVVHPQRDRVRPQPGLGEHARPRRPPCRSCGASCPRAHGLRHLRRAPLRTRVIPTRPDRGVDGRATPDRPFGIHVTLGVTQVPDGRVGDPCGGPDPE